jgi:anti-sigma-K factor RskA
VNTVRLCELAETYALGALDAEETRAFEAHLAGCPDCPGTVRQQREVAALLAYAAPPMTPRPELRERVLARAREGARVVPQRRPVRRLAPLAWAAALAGVLIGGLQTWRLARVSGTLRLLEDSLSGREHRLAELERQRNAILNDDVRMYVLGPQDTTRRVGGQVFWSRTQGTWLLHAFNLPRLAAGRAYQLWFVTADARISAGLLEPDPEGHAILVVSVPPPARRATLAAITEEPSGGSPQPTGPIVLAGSVEDTR